MIYLQTQITTGAKSAFFLRCKGDYDVATEGNPSAINTRAWIGSVGSPDPFISITYTVAAADDAIFFGTNF